MGHLPSPLQGHLAWLLSLACHLAGVGLLYLLASYSEPVLPAPRNPVPLLQATLITGQPGQQPARPPAAPPRVATAATPPASPEPVVNTPAPAKPPTPKPRIRQQAKAPRPHAAPEPKMEPTPSRSGLAVSAAVATVPAASVKPAATASAVSGATATASSAGSATDEPPLITHARYRGQPRPVEYPPQARQRGWQGTVVVEVWLDAQGHQLRRDIVQSSGRALLDRAALRSVARSDFHPYQENGQGRPSRLRLPVIFQLTHP